MGTDRAPRGPRPDVHRHPRAWHRAANPSWSISAIGAIELDARLRPSVDRPAILDVGSGLSTVVAAVAAARYGGRVVSLEHDPAYAERTRSMLAAAGVADVAEVSWRRSSARPPVRDAAPGTTASRRVGSTSSSSTARHSRPAAGWPAFPALAAHRRGDWEMWLFDADRADEQAVRGGLVARGSGSTARSRRSTRPGSRCSARAGSGTSGDAGRRAAGHLDPRGRTRRGCSERTLQSFERRWPEQVRAAHVCAFVNGDDEESRAVVEGAGWVDRTMTYGPDVIPVGLATSLVVGAVAAHGDVDLVLHLEDDWETRTLDDQALVRAAALLEDETVGQVRLRHRSDRCLDRHMVTGKQISWHPYDGHLRSEAHFTFNPSLIRAQHRRSGLPRPRRARRPASLHDHRARRRPARARGVHPLRATSGAGVSRWAGATGDWHASA